MVKISPNLNSFMVGKSGCGLVHPSVPPKSTLSVNSRSLPLYPACATNFPCLRGERGGNKNKEQKIFSRAAKGGQIFAVLNHYIAIFSAAFGGHPVGGGNSSK